MLGSQVVLAEMSVFSCEPEWKALAEEIGGQRVAVFSATTAAQDPHHIQARPSLIARLRRADLLVCTGAELEVGWLPLLLRRSRNPDVQPGQPGHLMAADQVTLLDVPKKLDRRHGDVHAQGNPHMHLAPRNLIPVAEALARRLSAIDPDGSGTYQANLEKFRNRWIEAIARWEQQAAPLRGTSVVVHHRDWLYLLAWLGIEQFAALEPRPGVPPSAGHLASLQSRIGQQRPLAILRSPINDAGPSEWLSRRTGVSPLVLPHTVGATEDAADLHAMFEALVSALLRVRQ